MLSTLLLGIARITSRQSPWCSCNVFIVGTKKPAGAGWVWGYESSDRAASMPSTCSIRGSSWARIAVVSAPVLSIGTTTSRSFCSASFFALRSTVWRPIKAILASSLRSGSFISSP